MRSGARKLIIVLCVFFLGTAPAFSDTQDGWSVISSDYCKITHDEGVTPSQLNKKLRLKRSVLYRYARAFSQGDPSAELGAKCDAIYKRVQEILNMYPSKSEVRVKIYSQKEDFFKLYTQFYNREFEGYQGKKERVLAFYRYRDNTVYIYAYHVSVSILAHEFAHAIMNHYFRTTVPSRTQEILATYVDSHFYDA